MSVIPLSHQAILTASYRDTALLKPPYFFVLFLFFLIHIYFPASGQAVVTGVVPSSPRFFPPIFFAHRVQQSHYSSIFHQVLLTHALALSASQFVHKKKSPRIYTSMHSGGSELTKLTYTRLEDKLIRHRGDRVCMPYALPGMRYALFVIRYRSYPTAGAALFFFGQAFLAG